VVSREEEELEAKVRAATVDEELDVFPVPLPLAGGLGVGFGAGGFPGVEPVPPLPVPVPLLPVLEPVPDPEDEFPEGEPVPPLPVPVPLLPVLEPVPEPEDPLLVPPEVPLSLVAIVIPFPGRPRGKGVGVKFGTTFGGTIRGSGVEPEESEPDVAVPLPPPVPVADPVLGGLNNELTAPGSGFARLLKGVKEFPEEAPSGLPCFTFVLESGERARRFGRFPEPRLELEGVFSVKTWVPLGFTGMGTFNVSLPAEAPEGLFENFSILRSENAVGA